MDQESKGLLARDQAAEDLLFSEDTFEMVFFEILLKMDFGSTDSLFT
jgi:hypothetical protein